MLPGFPFYSELEENHNLWNEDQINGAVVIFLKVIYINIIIDYCVQRQVDLIYMTPEYMAELHKFIYMSKDSDVDRLKEKVGNHLKYIPNHFLFSLFDNSVLNIRPPDNFRSYYIKNRNRRAKAG